MSTLKRNAFPQHIIDKVFRDYSNKQSKNVSSEPNSNNNPNSEVDNSVQPNIKYFKLPFIGFYSKLTERKLQNLIKRFCTDINIKLVFSSYKIKNMFGNKDSLPDELLSFVVYKFSCAACKSCYIGETTRHITTKDQGTHNN